MLPWWKKWPGRLEFELNELKKADIICEIDRKAFDAGIVVLNVRHPIEGRMHELIVKYPDTYPYMRFEIFAPEINLDHHQNPFEKNLCLIGRSTENWHPSYTAADFIMNQLPNVIRTGTDPDPVAASEFEAPQGEPISEFYPYATGHIVLIDSSWSIDPTVNGGLLTLGLDHSTPNRCYWAVIKVLDKDKNILAQAEPEISNLYPDPMWGRWIRSNEQIVENNPARIFEHILSISPNIVSQKQIMWSGKFIIGILFPEELSWRETKDSWLFLVLN